MTGIAPGIKPLQEGIRFSATLLGQRNRSISGGVLTLRCNCLKRCIEVSLVRIKDLHNVWVRITIEQLERVGPGGQNLSSCSIVILTQTLCRSLIRTRLTSMQRFRQLQRSVRTPPEILRLRWPSRVAENRMPS